MSEKGWTPEHTPEPKTQEQRAIEACANIPNPEELEITLLWARAAADLIKEWGQSCLAGESMESSFPPPKAQLVVNVWKNLAEALNRVYGIEVE